MNNIISIYKVKLFNKRKLKITEEDLIIKAQRGCNESFEKLIDKHKEYIYKTAFIYVKNEHDALDIYQETVFKAYMNISKLKNIKFFKTWITKILINNVNMKNRHYKKFEDCQVEDYIGDISYLNIEEKIDLYDAIDSLEEKYKTPIILQYFHDFSIAQISEITGNNENTIKSNIRRGKKKIYDLLKEDK